MWGYLVELLVCLVSHFFAYQKPLTTNDKNINQAPKQEIHTCRKQPSLQLPQEYFSQEKQTNNRKKKKPSLLLWLKGS